MAYSSGSFVLKFPLAEVFTSHTLNGIPPNAVGCVLYGFSLRMRASSRPKKQHGIEKNLSSLVLCVSFQK